MENFFSKKGNLVITLLIIALLSMFVFSKIASSPEFHSKAIQSLDDKKITVMELVTATTLASTAIAAIPSDATSPLANQIVELSEYLLIIIGVIFLEKILLTSTGYITFTFLIPISCLLFGIYLYVKKDIIKDIAIKLAIFGMAIFIVVPFSVKVSNLIENTYQTSINQTIEEAKKFEKESEKNNNKESEESGAFDKIISNTKGFIANIGDNVSELVDKGEKILNNFIDAIAVLLITSCVIPILVLLFFIWIIKVIIGINIPVKNIKSTIFKPAEKENKEALKQ